ncbi:hypothetical protein [Natronosalvus vescus]|nr:hypothetical protein [Natronosalvus vescus]
MLEINCTDPIAFQEHGTTVGQYATTDVVPLWEFDDQCSFEVTKRA